MERISKILHYGDGKGHRRPLQDHGLSVHGIVKMRPKFLLYPPDSYQRTPVPENFDFFFKEVRGKRTRERDKIWWVLGTSWT